MVLNGFEKVLIFIDTSSEIKYFESLKSLFIFNESAGFPSAGDIIFDFYLDFYLFLYKILETFNEL